MVMENKISTTVVAAIIIAVGLIGMGLAVRCGIVKFKKLDGTVSVKGLSEMEMPADKVIWPLTYVAAGDDLTALYANIESKNAIITKFLLDNGISKNEITESAPVVTDLKAQSYYGDSKSEYRYNITSVTTVSTNKVNLVRDLLVKQSELIKQGVPLSSGGNAEFSFTKLNDVKPKMIEEATKNARASAQKFAEDSHSHLGKIKNATQGQFSIEDRDSNTPYIKSLRVVTTVEYYMN
jgi:hypothetical protein